MALGYRKYDKSEPAVMLQSKGELNAQQLDHRFDGGAGEPGAEQSRYPTCRPSPSRRFQNFLQETRYAQDSDREYQTLQNLNQLAAFLGSFPGRKNVIWMSGAFPVELFGQTDMRFDDSIKTTINLLSAARVAIYPVDVRGTNVQQFYTAENVLDPTITNGAQLLGAPPGAAANPPSAGVQGGFLRWPAERKREAGKSATRRWICWPSKPAAKRSTTRMICRESSARSSDPALIFIRFRTPEQCQYGWRVPEDRSEGR